MQHIARGIVRLGLKPVPPKRAISLRVDADVLEWLKTQGPGYQTRINAILRAYKDAASRGKTGARRLSSSHRQRRTSRAAPGRRPDVNGVTTGANTPRGLCDGILHSSPPYLGVGSERVIPTQRVSYCFVSACRWFRLRGLSARPRFALRSASAASRCVSSSNCAHTFGFVLLRFASSGSLIGLLPEPHGTSE